MGYLDCSLFVRARRGNFIYAHIPRTTPLCAQSQEIGDIMIGRAYYARKEWHISFANDHHHHYPFALNECGCCSCHQKDYTSYRLHLPRVLFVIAAPFLSLSLSFPCLYWRLLVNLYKQVISIHCYLSTVDKTRIRIFSQRRYCILLSSPDETNVFNAYYQRSVRELVSSRYLYKCSRSALNDNDQHSHIALIA